MPPVTPSRTSALDAIIVPASRPATNLDHAISLAREMECHLVLLCSREARADEVSQRLATESLEQATVIALPTGYSHELFDFSTSLLADFYLPYKCAARDSDLSAKRNVGLILARMLGWKRIFFLDDDILGLSSFAVRHAVSMLTRYNTVGMRVTDFPDNSVVCHAHRATGGRQDVHVSGSALAVNCAAPIGFFPDIYNEDWLFFYKDAANQRLGSSVLRAKQLRYDPFIDPERAARQEFGDVLAEGLYALLQNGCRGNSTRDYWIQFLSARQRFLKAVTARAGRAQPQIRDAVDTAQECLMNIHPDFCESYIKDWRHDLQSWDERLKGISTVHSIGEAIGQLHLRAENINTDKVVALQADVPRNVPVGTLAAQSVTMLNGLSAKCPPPPSPGVMSDHVAGVPWIRGAKPSLAWARIDATEAPWAKLTDASRVFCLSAVVFVMQLLALRLGSPSLMAGRGRSRRMIVGLHRWHRDPWPAQAACPPDATKPPIVRSP